MSILRSFSRAFGLLALGLFLYDIVYAWVVEARFNIRTVPEWFAYVTGAELDLPARVMAMPAPVACLILSAIFYVLYRGAMLAAGKGRAHRL